MSSNPKIKGEIPKKALAFSLLIGCNTEKISIDGGTYSFASINGVDGEFSTDLLLELGYIDDGQAGDFSFTVSGQELVSGTYADAPESDWLQGCPTNFSATTLKTNVLDTSSDFGDVFETAVNFETPMSPQDAPFLVQQGEEFPDEIYLYDKSDTSLGVGPCPGLVCQWCLSKLVS